MASLISTVRDIERLRQIIVVLVRHGFGEIVQRTGLSSAAPAELDTEASNEAAKKSSFGTRLRLVLQDLGPSFVKLGQILSFAAEVVPENARNALAKL